MKIAYVVPGRMDEKEAKRREAIMRSWVNPGTQIDIVTPQNGPTSIESTIEEILSVSQAAVMTAKCEQDGYDAVILGCAGDPGIDGIREVSRNMLVTGPGMISLLTGCMLGRHIGMLETDDNLLDSCREMAFRVGCLERLAGAASIDTPVLDLSKPELKEQNVQRISAACKKLMKEDKVDVIVLGCMSMAFMDIAEDIQKEIGIPVVNPAKVAVRMTETLVWCGLMHSEKAYPTPVKLTSGEYTSALDMLLSCGATF